MSWEKVLHEAELRNKIFCYRLGDLIINMPEARFSKVLIISSLPDDENQTGKDLYDWLRAVKHSQNWDILLEYEEVDNATALVSLLQYETSNILTTGLVPIIHIEAHGTDDEDGIFLKNGSHVTWEDLHPYLVDLNIATRLNTILILGLCSGAHFTAHMIPSDRSPCWILIGPKSTLLDLHLRDRFKEFYREIFKTGDGGEALRLLNKSSDYGEANSFFTPTAEYFFKVTYRKYLAELCTDDACRARASKIREHLKEVMFPVPHQREIALMLSANKAVFFEDHKIKFFMIDLNEEHRDRFRITYEDVIDD